jgi:hypothetical protein
MLRELFLFNHVQNQLKCQTVDWYVVNSDNLDEFLGRIEADVGNVVFIAVTPKGYENLALGIADLRRYINQQNELIVYYEQQATNNIDENNP